MRSGGLAGGLDEVDSEAPAALIRTLLGFLRRRLDLDFAWIASFRDGAYVIDEFDGEPGVGDPVADRVLSVADSYGVRVIDGRLPAVIPDTSRNQTAAALSITGELGVGSYIGAPIHGSDGAPVGMVSVVGGGPTPDLDDDDLMLVTQVADLISTLITPPDSGPDRGAEQRNAIRRVVAEQDFEVNFQAVHDIATGRVVGVEALARFSCEPYRPDAFFAQAAELGLGIELEQAIVARVVKTMPTLPPDAFVAINISPAAALVLPWDELLAPADRSRIVLEITEHSAVPDYEALDDVMEECRSYGMRVAVDDVGAGFASFSHVLELGPEFVKIDQSITRNIDVDDARRRLAQAIAEFAGQIGATVIAEGVETQGELDAVSAAGISLAQGFYLSRPKPFEHGFPPAEVSATPSDPMQSAAVDLLGERRFELALAHSPIGMCVVGLDGTFLRTNRALRTMLGYNRKAMQKLTFQDITHPDDLQLDLTLVNECLEGRRRSFRMDKRYIASDGRIVWGALTAVLVHAPRDRPQCFVSQIVDVTAEREREAELARQANTDQLTSIANRSAAWRRLEELDAEGKGYGVLFCDIERFKAVNDRNGHHAGDRLLVAVAGRLLAAIGGDGMVARWGGDEFLVITTSFDDHSLASLARRISDELDSVPISLPDGTVLPVVLTIGSASHRPGDGRSIDSVLDRADHAMYDQRRHRSRSGRRGPGGLVRRA
ncbi:EAL domain-containing protein [Mycolicibacterium sp. BiH015]|uniref:EAL domain-containing protein n=1 Tax=Mycolicibacterium sp. BiH015 TaxID=3018808 RepID=UPI0022E3D57F|nr:EAL domain-containing protein [Mycolicibacterium sp. BiH015]MDA2891938.1 EAL domain-containing protein [Mycolicibacterium sp. BiH015]